MAISAAIFIKFLYSAFTILNRRKQETIDKMDTLYDVDSDNRNRSLNLKLLHGKRAA